tara:strand:+ start:2918 stop:3274 length:357 start_codon:yes stop_codon:yes gene_type:complete
MKNFIQLSAVTLSFLLLTACSNSSDDDIGPIDPPINNDITYTGTVKAIIDSNCLGCHTNPPVNGAPMPLTTYSEVKSAVQTRGLISQIESGNMPQGGTMLSNASIQAIKDWQTDGFVQ